jgi:hypothetical protein
MIIAKSFSTDKPGKLLKEAYMQKFSRKLLIYFLVFAFVLVSLPAGVFAQDPTMREEIPTENMVVDALLVRPLGLCAVILGAGFFVISLPFSLLGGNVKDAGKKLVVDPAAFTFKRPLGEF